LVAVQKSLGEIPILAIGNFNLKKCASGYKRDENPTSSLIAGIDESQTGCLW